MRTIDASLNVRGLVSGIVLAIVLAAGVSRGEVSARIDVPPVSARIALSSLVALSDGHMQKLADSLALLATTEGVRSADWTRIRGALQEAAKVNVEATLWFALPDGSYWTLQQGRIAQKLANRPYFPRLLAGETVIGELVVSKSTGRSVGIVAIPIRGKDGAVVGALGASVPLDKLSARIEREMSLDSTTIFYAFDGSLALAIVWDPSLILAKGTALSKEVGEAFQQMRTQREGAISYTYRGKRRAVEFRKSTVTGWWYAFGVIPEGREPPGPRTRG